MHRDWELIGWWGSGICRERSVLSVDGGRCLESIGIKRAIHGERKGNYGFDAGYVRGLRRRRREWRGIGWEKGGWSGLRRLLEGRPCAMVIVERDNEESESDSRTHNLIARHASISSNTHNPAHRDPPPHHLSPTSSRPLHVPPYLSSILPTTLRVFRRVELSDPLRPTEERWLVCNAFKTNTGFLRQLPMVYRVAAWKETVCRVS